MEKQEKKKPRIDFDNPQPTREVNLPNPDPGLDLIQSRGGKKYSPEEKEEMRKKLKEAGF